MCAAKMGPCKQDHWDFKPISSFFLIIHVIPPDFKNIVKSPTYLEAECLTKTNIIFNQLITTLIQVLVKQFLAVTILSNRQYRDCDSVDLLVLDVVKIEQLCCSNMIGV